MIKACIDGLHERLARIKKNTRLYSAYENIVVQGLTDPEADEDMQAICRSIADTLRIPAEAFSQEKRESLCWYAKKELMFALHVVLLCGFHE